MLQASNNQTTSSPFPRRKKHLHLISLPGLVYLHLPLLKSLKVMFNYGKVPLLIVQGIQTQAIQEQILNHF